MVRMISTAFTNYFGLLQLINVDDGIVCTFSYINNHQVPYWIKASHYMSVNEIYILIWSVRHSFPWMQVSIHINDACKEYRPNLFICTYQESLQYHDLVAINFDGKPQIFLLYSLQSGSLIMYKGPGPHLFFLAGKFSNLT